MDRKFTALQQPDSPFVTIGIEYAHGFVLAGPDNVYNIPGLQLFNLAVQDEHIVVTIGETQFTLPLYIDLFRLGSQAADIDKTMR
ncbi:MAG: hypothetical protein FH749_09120 [Firmicutes bacterium]|nr:hypothetical protein [Bacillota bacterium]